MFQISPTVMAAFQAEAFAEFHSRLARILWEELPDQTVPLAPDELRVRISAGHSAALAHGVETETGVGKWMILDLVNGPEFHRDTKFREFWDQSGLPDDERYDLEPEEKLDLLLGGLVDRQRRGDL